MKAAIEKFNGNYYQPDCPPVPSITSGNGATSLMVGMGGVGAEGGATGDSITAEEDQLIPLDLNYINVLGKEVCG